MDRHGASPLCPPAPVPEGDPEGVRPARLRRQRQHHSVQERGQGAFQERARAHDGGSKFPVKLKDFFEVMDQNGDQKLDFPEFMAMLGFIACVSNNRLCERPPERCGVTPQVCEPVNPTCLG
ncbi:hypothetical protein WMY93_014847 [Mugilogobius chulae]|uniref:EF-hand domain-containing protein n=1 Tax=Mugilogobius chulae TaxID=88201 RepID=A0AAW0P0D2_9GOBI